MRVPDVRVERLAAQIVELKAQIAMANAEQRKVLRLRLKACRVLLRWNNSRVGVVTDCLLPESVART